MPWLVYFCPHCQWSNSRWGKFFFWLFLGEKPNMSRQKFSGIKGQKKPTPTHCENNSINSIWIQSCMWFCCFTLMKGNCFDVGEEVKNMIGDIFNRAPEARPRLLSSTRIKMRPRSHSKSSVHGIVRRSRSIQVDPAQAKGKHILLSPLLQTI